MDNVAFTRYFNTVVPEDNNDEQEEIIIVPESNDVSFAMNIARHMMSYMGSSKFKVVKPCEREIVIDYERRLQSLTEKFTNNNAYELFEPIYRRIARAGFYHFDKYTVSCMSCGVLAKLKDFFYKDPADVHIQKSSNCIFSWIANIDRRDDQREIGNQCVLCCDNLKTICFWPCMHLATCAECAVKNGSKCCTCRGDVIGLMKIHVV